MKAQQAMHKADTAMEEALRLLREANRSTYILDLNKINDITDSKFIRAIADLSDNNVSRAWLLYKADMLDEKDT